jgi:hypothetical protein
MALVMEKAPENVSWIDAASDATKALAVLSAGVAFVAIPLVGLVNHTFNLGVSGGELTTYGTSVMALAGGVLAVGVVSTMLGMPLNYIQEKMSKSRNYAANTLTLATQKVESQLTALGYDLNLEMGGRKSEPEYRELNKKAYKISREVAEIARNMDMHTTKNLQTSDILTTAFVIGNENNRSDMTMISATQGLIAGLEIMVNDHKAIVPAQVALNDVVIRDNDKKRLEESGPSLG